MDRAGVESSRIERVNTYWSERSKMYSDMSLPRLAKARDKILGNVWQGTAESMTITETMFGGYN